MKHDHTGLFIFYREVENGNGFVMCGIAFTLPGTGFPPGSLKEALAFSIIILPRGFPSSVNGASCVDKTSVSLAGSKLFPFLLKPSD